MAASKDPALLEALAPLLGEWRMTLTNGAFLPDPAGEVTGALEVAPIEGGWLVALRQYADRGDAPLASWIVGRDGIDDEFTVLYADGRGITRVYRMALDRDEWSIWRDDPRFAQRFAATIAPGGDAIHGRWERRPEGADWEHDFDVAYHRVR